MILFTPLGDPMGVKIAHKKALKTTDKNRQCK